MAAIVECVPNFSEGRDVSVINAISGSISAAGCKVLHTDIGYDTNRTVITFAGTSDDVFQGAFDAVRRASELIDMRRHTGTHPRQGATDVLPLVPVSGISMEECAALARNLAEKIYKVLGIPCYCYGESAYKPERKRLEVCRAGEYEAMEAKIADPAQRPDFCGDTYTLQAARSGATTVGARDFLIAVNFNLDTADVKAAKAIALEVRARGWNGIAGLLPGCKAIGWYIPEYGFAQVSMNITDISLTPLHMAYETVCTRAALRGLTVTGTEIIGLVPKRVLVDAGRHFGCTGNDNEMMDLAIKKMGLNTIRPYNVEERVLEYLL
ncbi:MAG: glutamate formimidoyltransferase [Bacteroidales bacterium]|nr:glutamate formimidoyltransferase [Bacteroidales bacterium]